MTKPAWFLLHAIPTAMLLIALWRMPYGYYQLLRIAVGITAAAVALATYARTRQQNGYTWLFTIIAVIFNPIIPFHLGSRDIWRVLNVAAAAVFAFSWWDNPRPNSENPSPPQGG